MSRVKEDVADVVEGVHAVLLTSIAAVTTLFLLKLQNKKHDVIRVCMSFMAVAFLTRVEKKRYEDEIRIFFTEEEKKSIVTLYESSISEIRITGNVSGTGQHPYVMLVVLNKKIIGQGNKRLADRRVGITGYRHVWDCDTAEQSNPQVVLSLACKGHNRSTEACFAHLKGKNSLRIQLQSRRYEEFIPVHSKNFEVYIRKVVQLEINKKSFLCILLEKFVLTHVTDENLQKAIFLVSRFSLLLQKTVVASLKTKCSQILKQQDDVCKTANSEGNDHITRLLKLLNGTFLDTTHILSTPVMKSLEGDILELIKERAYQYENLHEALRHEIYSDKMQLGIEEIVACYPDKVSQMQTSILLKKLILLDKKLHEKMKIIHEYIDSYKKLFNGKMQEAILGTEVYPSSSCSVTDEAKYAHNAMCTLIGNYIKRDGHNNLNFIVNYARNVVAKKHGYSFVGDITGILERVSSNIGEIGIMVERMRYGQSVGTYRPLPKHTMSNTSSSQITVHASSKLTTS